MSTIKVKLKVCEGCGKSKPVFSNIKGKPYCEYCSKKEKAKIAKEKRKEKREKKRESISSLTKELDRVFSLFIRMRDSNSEGMGRCITCDKILHYKEGHNGHFRSRKYMSTRWSPTNCNLQCPTCNLYNNGEEFIHGLKIDEKFGQGTAMEMYKRSQEIMKFSKEDLKTLIDYYKGVVEVGVPRGIY